MHYVLPVQGNANQDQETGSRSKVGFWVLYGVVGQPGLEPGTSVLSGLRSSQLSYWPVNRLRVYRRRLGSVKERSGV